MESFVFAGPVEGKERVEYRGIPFMVEKGKGNSYNSLEYRKHILHEPFYPVEGTCSVAFLLGMVTQLTEGSEWWGPAAGTWTEHNRTYIGDKLGHVVIAYADHSAEIFPLIFGVNVWNYELTHSLQEGEDIFDYWGPYDEPFRSDPEAKRLLDESLALMENDGAIKGGHYILAIKLKEKPLHEFKYLSDLTAKSAGIHISAASFLKAGEPIDPSWRIMSSEYFWQGEYLPASERLARRLYQFRDEIPEYVAPDQPAGYTGPKVWFEGDNTANILANAFAYNYHDIFTSKIDADGKTHTSSKDAPSFGTYIGIGTYKILAPYYYHMWSRDVGRTVIEGARTGEKDRIAHSADSFVHYLYDNPSFPVPSISRLANYTENNCQDKTTKENDGHASMMLGVYSAWATGAVDDAWLKKNEKALFDFANWFWWQMDNPELSHFDRLFWSESEASTQQYGGLDLFSNTMVYYAMVAYVELFTVIGRTDLADKAHATAAYLKENMMAVFTREHPRYGQVFFDTLLDCWSYAYKRFAPVFVASDVLGYDPTDWDADFLRLTRAAYEAQKEEYFNPASGRQMGYGQGYITETALMLDEYADFTKAVEYSALYCYNSHEFNYIVPEGVLMHPTGRYWVRNSDLGNGVQQGEIMKAIRLVIGLDDLHPQTGLSIIPRLPDSWSVLEVEDYQIAVNADGGRRGVPVRMKYTRTEKGYCLTFSADEPVLVHNLRIGPFAPEAQLKGNVSFTEQIIAGRKFAYCAVDAKVQQQEITISE